MAAATIAWASPTEWSNTRSVLLAWVCPAALG
jgi:hypothetical protein